MCSLTISASGRFIASGQVGTSNYKGNAAPVILWRSDTGQRLGVLRGLSDRANILEFSPDEKFLCGCGEVKKYKIKPIFALIVTLHDTNSFLGLLNIYLGYIHGRMCLCTKAAYSHYSV